jgi:hypothetical protein
MREPEDLAQQSLREYGATVGDAFNTMLVDS